MAMEPQPMQQPQPQPEQGQGMEQAEQLAQQIAAQIEQLKGMIPPEIFQGFLQTISQGSQPQEQEPQGPVGGPAPAEGGVGGAPRI